MTAIYCVKVEVAPSAERAWDDWNTAHHIPDVLAQPGFLRASKYRLDSKAPDGWSRYWVLYEVQSCAALDAYLSGEAVKRLRADHLERFADTTRLTREILEPVARVET